MCIQGLPWSPIFPKSAYPSNGASFLIVQLIQMFWRGVKNLPLILDTPENSGDYFCVLIIRASV